MTGFLDEISPDYIGAERIGLSLASATAAPKAFAGVEVLVDYSGCLPDGVVPPLLFSVLAPTRDNYEERIIRRHAPGSLLFVPREGGRHTVRIGELFHHRWFGTLDVDVQGDPLDPEALSRG